MIKPVNDHLLIEPVKQESFIASQRDSYEEIGVVVAVPEIITNAYENEKPKVGDKVYFDSWMCAKFPKDKESFYYLVKWDDVRAVSND